MEGEKIKIFGITHIHYENKVKLPNFEPRNAELRAIHRRYWYCIDNFLLFLAQFILKLNI
jgi:hypothetical protein